MAPPAQYMQDTPIPLYVDPYNRGLASHAKALKSALVSCNADKESMREWATLIATPTQ